MSRRWTIFAALVLVALAGIGAEVGWFLHARGELLNQISEATAKKQRHEEMLLNLRKEEETLRLQVERQNQTVVETTLRSEAGSSEQGRKPESGIAGGGENTQAGGEPGGPPAQPSPALTPAEKKYRESLALSGEAELEALRAAIRLDPNNPAYHAELVGRLIGRLTQDNLPEILHELQEWERVDKDNALPNYVRAGLYFDERRISAALQELTVGIAKQRIEPYSMVQTRTRIELVLERNGSTIEAICAMAGTVLPFLACCRKVARAAVEAGHEADSARRGFEAETLYRAAVRMGEQFEGRPSFLIDDLVAIAVKKTGLQALESLSSLPAQEREAIAGQTRLLGLRKKELSFLMSRYDLTRPVPGATRDDYIEFLRVMVEEGEVRAYQNSALVGKAALGE